jgi:nucleoside-diphosphate-sugar epimerase
MIPIYFPAAAAIAAVLLSRLGLRSTAPGKKRSRPRSAGRDGKTSRVLVTGASGFLGHAVIAAFARDGFLLRASVRRRPVPPFPGNVEVVQNPDLARPFDWRPLLRGVDVVIHLAGIEHGGRKLAPDAYHRINTQATSELAVAAAKAGIRHFVLVSSIRAQSGPVSDHALTERDAAVPTDAHGRSKLGAEEAVRSSGVPFTILRLVPVYGPGMQGSLALLFRAAASSLPLPVKEFSNRRSYLGLDNFISALRFVLATPAAFGETYVVADPGIPPATSDLIATMRRALGRRVLVLPIQIRFAEVPLRMMRLGELWDRYCGNLRVDPAKLIAAGWQPLHDTRAGFTAMLQQAQPPSRKATPPAALQAPDRPQPRPD